MPKTATKNAKNMYLMSRSAAGVNRLDASWMLHVNDRTLARYESGESVPPPDVVLAMETKYGDTALTARHCAEICAIGRKYAHNVEIKDMPVAVLGFLKESKGVYLLRDKLIELAADGRITEEEMPEYERIMAGILALEEKIETLKLTSHNVLPISEMIARRKEKAAVLSG